MISDCVVGKGIEQYIRLSVDSKSLTYSLLSWTGHSSTLEPIFLKPSLSFQAYRKTYFYFNIVTRRCCVQPIYSEKDMVLTRESHLGPSLALCLNIIEIFRKVTIPKTEQAAMTALWQAVLATCRLSSDVRWSDQVQTWLLSLSVRSSLPDAHMVSRSQIAGEHLGRQFVITLGSLSSLDLD